MAKIDCSVTANFLSERQRMCDSYKHGCGNCALREASRYTEHTCSDYTYNNPDKAVGIIQKWSDEHPPKTRLDDIKERCPNVPLDGEGFPCFKPVMLGYCDNCDRCQNWKKPDTRNCWNEPLDGGATGEAVE